MHLKLLQKERFRETAEAASDLIGNKTADKIKRVSSDLIGNKTADKITRVSKTSPQNNPEINEEEILRERFISPERRQKITDDLRLKW